MKKPVKPTPRLARRPFKRVDNPKVGDVSHIRAFGLTPTSRMFPMGKIKKKDRDKIEKKTKVLVRLVKKSNVPNVFHQSCMQYFAELKANTTHSQRWLFALRQLVSLTDCGTRADKDKHIKYLNAAMAMDLCGELENLLHVLTLDGKPMMVSTNVEEINSWANLLTIKTSPTRVVTTEIKLNEVSEELRSFMDGYKPRKKKKGKK